MIDVSNTQEQMDNMTVLQLKEKIAERLPQNAGKIYLFIFFIFVLLLNIVHVSRRFPNTRAKGIGKWTLFM